MRVEVRRRYSTSALPEQLSAMLMYVRWYAFHGSCHHMAACEPPFRVRIKQSTAELARFRSHRTIHSLARRLSAVTCPLPY